MHIEICYFVFQYYYLTDVYKFITVAVFIVISILEGIRLYLGYLGNLAEKVNWEFSKKVSISRVEQLNCMNILRLYKELHMF